MSDHPTPPSRKPPFSPPSDHPSRPRGPSTLRRTPFPGIFESTRAQRMFEPSADPLAPGGPDSPLTQLLAFKTWLAQDNVPALQQHLTRQTTLADLDVARHRIQVAASQVMVQGPQGPWSGALMAWPLVLQLSQSLVMPAAVRTDHGDTALWQRALLECWAAVQPGMGQPGVKWRFDAAIWHADPLYDGHTLPQHRWLRRAASGFGTGDWASPPPQKLPLPRGLSAFRTAMALPPSRTPQRWRVDGRRSLALLLRAAVFWRGADRRPELVASSEVCNRLAALVAGHFPGEAGLRQIWVHPPLPWLLGLQAVHTMQSSAMLAHGVSHGRAVHLFQPDLKPPGPWETARLWMQYMDPAETEDPDSDPDLETWEYANWWRHSGHLTALQDGLGPGWMAATAAGPLDAGTHGRPH